MPTTSIKEVAALARVSVGTVSNVLNRPDVVALATRERVEQAIEQLGFVRNESARALRAGRSRTVGLLVLDIGNPFFTDVARGAEAVADANGAVVTLYNSDQDGSRELRLLQHLEEQRVQGVLVTPVDLLGAGMARLLSRGTPVVLVDRRAGRRTQCSVAVDDVLGGQLAVEHLRQHAHSRIAFVGGPFILPQVADRLAGTREALDGSAAVLTVVETPELSVAAGREAGARIAAERAGLRPTAAFCANDLVALGFLQAMTKEGIRVPQEMAIVGYDDIDYAAAAAVPLSSVRQPRDQLGRTAAELLFEEINDNGHHRHRQVVFQPELVVRESSQHQRRRRAGAPRPLQTE